MANSENILITGAAGQIGTELTELLRKKHGGNRVIATDIRPAEAHGLDRNGPYMKLDVLDTGKLDNLLQKHAITQVYHMAAVLSATGEQIPQKAWQVNMQGLLNMLELAVKHNVRQVFWPSSIAVFGPTTPKQDTPQNTVMDPDTVYGISKLAGERWCAYYHKKHGLDVRSIRYPGLISHKAEPGGGTTDYAVEIFHKAAQGDSFECFLAQDTRLPMLYMPDALRATLQLMEAPADNLTVRSAYNVGGLSFSPAELAESIQKVVPGFQTTYKPDYRQEIASSWPQRVDGSVARKDWKWQPKYGIDDMTADMLKHVRKQDPTTI